MLITVERVLIFLILILVMLLVSFTVSLFFFRRINNTMRRQVRNLHARLDLLESVYKAMSTSLSEKGSKNKNAAGTGEEDPTPILYALQNTLGEMGRDLLTLNNRLISLEQFLPAPKENPALIEVSSPLGEEEIDDPSITSVPITLEDLYNELRLCNNEDDFITKVKSVRLGLKYHPEMDANSVYDFFMVTDLNGLFWLVLDGNETGSVFPVFDASVKGKYRSIYSRVYEIIEVKNPSRDFTVEKAAKIKKTGPNRFELSEKGRISLI